MRRDLFWAYAASGARIVSGLIVLAFVFRKGGKEEFGMFSLVRGTIGILNYTAVGLAPAMVRMLAEAKNRATPLRATPARDSAILEYHTPSPAGERVVYASAFLLAVLSLAIGLVLTGVYAHYFSIWHRVPTALVRSMPAVVLYIGVGTLLRLFSDVPGAVLQTQHRIATDNKLLAVAEVLWVALTLLLGSWNPLVGAAGAYVGASAVLLYLRGVTAGVPEEGPDSKVTVDPAVVARLFQLGMLVLIAQLADYLYSPTDYILIDHFLGPPDVGAYAPAVQIDSGMLTLVTALSAVLLPKAALAHTSGSIETVRRYYIRGTLASLAVLVMAAAAVWLAAPWLLHLWLGSDPGTTFILPLVLIHTVLGGSSAVGRSILLAMGKFKPFTASVLIAGATNVVASYCFVKYLHWGLRGIVLGTIVAVVGRCALWMPWYVMRVLKEQGAMPQNRLDN